jgi:hypothetical protein
VSSLILKQNRLRAVICADQSSEAEHYLPTTMDKVGNPWITLYLGPHDQTRAVHMGAFHSMRIGQRTVL